MVNGDILDLLGKILQFESTRIGMEELLEHPFLQQDRYNESKEDESVDDDKVDVMNQIPSESPIHSISPDGYIHDEMDDDVSTTLSISTEGTESKDGNVDEPENSRKR